MTASIKTPTDYFEQGSSHGAPGKPGTYKALEAHGVIDKFATSVNKQKAVGDSLERSPQPTRLSRRAKAGIALAAVTAGVIGHAADVPDKASDIKNHILENDPMTTTDQDINNPNDVHVPELTENPEDMVVTVNNSQTPGNGHE